MTKERGKLIRWDDEKGYGFIRPDKGGDDRFLHARALPHFQRRPRVNDLIAYETEMDSKGRSKAVKAKIVGRVWSLFTKIWVASVFVFTAYAVCVFLNILPFHFISLYAFMSILTIQQYSIDKGEAQAGRWRTSEANLHFFELAGGWPGALFAQYFYRHKYRKLSYQIVFWVIVLIHGISWAWMAAHPDALNKCKNALVSSVQERLLEGRPSPPPPATEQIPVTHTIYGNPVAQRTPEIHAQTRVSVKKLISDGIITEVNPRAGIFVTSPTHFEGSGIIDKANLPPGFATQFHRGETVQVTIKSISMKGSEKQINLELADK